jgi:2,3-diaminopropionate biosynthesis protein SbnB
VITMLAPGKTQLAVVTGDTIQDDLPRLRRAVLDLVRTTYIQHRAGDAINPGSQFLTFPDRPDARIISLPAAIGGDRPVAGMKWISSFPSNTAHGSQRASAVLILNDPDTGYPYACLEASRVSAARTAASAALAAAVLSHSGRQARRMLFVGAGVIARNILDFLLDDGWRINRLSVNDTSAASATALVRYASDICHLPADVAPDLRRSLAECDVVVFATVARTPHVHAPCPLPAGQTVLHISLRDLAPELVRHAFNVVDDGEHCLTAGTSLHLAAQRWGKSGLISASIGELLSEPTDLPDDRARVFSPFGLGVLDVAVGRLFLEAALRAGRAHLIDDFLGDLRRW